MARTRTVFPTARIAHLWAHQAQSEARNPQGNLYFRDRVLFSYRDSYPIGRLVSSPHKKPLQAVLLQEDTYSSTTAHHCKDARSATSHMQRFTVPSLTPNHIVNLDWYQHQITKLEAETRKSRIYTEACYRRMRGMVNEANEYAGFFKIRKTFKTTITESEYAELLRKSEPRIAMNHAAGARRAAARNERWAQMSEENRRCHEAYQTEQERLKNLTDDELTAILAEWSRGGEPKDFHYAASRLRRTCLRIVGNEVETSMGAAFPVAHARLGLALVRRVMASGEEWNTNGHTLHLGHYKIDRITPDGTVYAGCHIVKWAEIERIAGQIESAGKLWCECDGTIDDPVMVNCPIHGMPEVKS